VAIKLRNRKAAFGFIFTTVWIAVIGLGIIIPVIPDIYAAQNENVEY